MLFVIFITLKDKKIIVFIDPIFKVEGSKLKFFLKPKRCEWEIYEVF